MTVVITQNTNTGETESASNTSRFVNRYEEISGEKLDYAILSGICAGSKRRDKVDLGDVVTPHHIFDRSVYKITLTEEGEKRRVDELRSPGKPNEYLVRLCKGISQNFTWFGKIVSNCAEGHKFPPSIHIDPLFTDNIFLEDATYMEQCKDLFNRKSIAYEMEAGGFATACNQDNVPFIIIRGISDWADENASDSSFRKYASLTSAAFVYELLQKANIPSL